METKKKVTPSTKLKTYPPKQNKVSLSDTFKQGYQTFKLDGKTDVEKKEVFTKINHYLTTLLKIMFKFGVMIALYSFSVKIFFMLYDKFGFEKVMIIMIVSLSFGLGQFYSNFTKMFKEKNKGDNPQ